MTLEEVRDYLILEASMLEQDADEEGTKFKIPCEKGVCNGITLT